MPGHGLIIILQNCFRLTVGDIITNICVKRMKMSEKRKQFRAENCKCKAQKLKKKYEAPFEVPKKTKLGDEPNHRECQNMTLLPSKWLELALAKTV